MSNSDRLSLADPQAAARKAWVRQHRELQAAYDRLVAEGVPAHEMARQLPGFDKELFTGLVCGARSRHTGKPCRLVALCRGGRCRYHGGLSTGPRTKAGKERVAANLRPQQGQS